MKLSGLRDEITDTMMDAIKDAIEGEDKVAVTCVNTTDGYIDLLMKRGEDVSCLVTHDDDCHKNSPNLEKWVEDIISPLKEECIWASLEESIFSIEAV